jgi:hypothetical protein
MAAVQNKTVLYHAIFSKLKKNVRAFSRNLRGGTLSSRLANNEIYGHAKKQCKVPENCNWQLKSGFWGIFFFLLSMHNLP